MKSIESRQDLGDRAQLQVPLFEQGQAFLQSPAADVLAFLRSRKREDLVCEPQRVRIVAHGAQLIVQHVNGKAREWPMRATFFEKLLRWYHIPAGPLQRMDQASVVPLLNGILDIIRNTVTLTIEDGDALTITSRKYSPVKDIELIGQCTGRGLSSITRTDYFMRAYFEERIKAEPIPGDPCGFGFNMLNSETGFMALRICPFIYRYTCKNGAVVFVNLGGANVGLIHYGFSNEEIQAHLDRAFHASEQCLPRLATLLKNSTKQPCPGHNDVERSLDSILGFSRGARFLKSFAFADTTTLYELFNFITAEAQSHSPGIRLRLEEYAGSLLRPSHPMPHENQDALFN